MSYDNGVVEHFIRGGMGGETGWYDHYGTAEFAMKFSITNDDKSVRDNFVLVRIPGHVECAIPLKVEGKRYCIFANLGSNMGNDPRFKQGVYIKEIAEKPITESQLSVYANEPSGKLKLDKFTRDQKQNMRKSESKRQSFYKEVFSECKDPLVLTKKQFLAIKKAIEYLNNTKKFRKQKLHNCFYKHPKQAVLMVNSIKMFIDPNNTDSFTLCYESCKNKAKELIYKRTLECLKNHNSILTEAFSKKPGAWNTWLEKKIIGVMDNRDKKVMDYVCTQLQQSKWETKIA